LGESVHEAVECSPYCFQALNMKNTAIQTILKDDLNVSLQNSYDCWRW